MQSRRMYPMVAKRHGQLKHHFNATLGAAFSSVEGLKFLLRAMQRLISNKAQRHFSAPTSTPEEYHYYSLCAVTRALGALVRRGGEAEEGFDDSWERSQGSSRSSDQHMSFLSK